MHLFDCFQILKVPIVNSTFASNINKKIVALKNIAKEGSPTHIPDLIKFLKVDNAALRDETCDTIAQLFQKITKKNSYYETLKNCEISHADLDFYENNFSKERYHSLLQISSLNNSGWIREKAVKNLSITLDARAIPFLIYRLSDWVEQVRDAALKGLEQYKNSDFLDAIIENLPFLDDLKYVNRVDLGHIYRSFFEFVVLKKRAHVVNHFEVYPDKARLIIAKKLLATNYQLNELKMLLRDKHFLIRSLALSHFDHLEQSDIEVLLRDKSTKIRLQTLYLLRNSPNATTVFPNYLADVAASIRQLARLVLKDTNIDFTNFYYQKLLDGDQILGAMMGLAEVGANEHLEDIRTYLNHPQLKLKKVAFLAMKKLDGNSVFDYALEQLNTTAVSWRNMLIDFLVKTPNKQVLEKARSCYFSGNIELKKAMLKLFHKIGAWIAFPDLILGLVDEEEEVRMLSYEYLQYWKIRAISLFSKPKQEEKERALNFLTFVSGVLESKKYFRENPVENLAFYFK